MSDREKESFLLNAKITDRHTLETGVTLSSRATLTDGRHTHDAHIQTINFYRHRYQTDERTYLDFYDSYKYNIAAYRLDRLLALNMVPVSVERKVDHKPAAVSWWVEDVILTGRERHQRRIKPPDVAMWNNQKYQARVFQQLIYNADPNLGNQLITSEWRLWLIDFTRAFRTHRQLPDPKSFKKIDRQLYEALRRLDRPSLEQAVDGYLRPSEIKTLLARRDRILTLFDKRIADLGESAVVFERPEY